MAHSWALVSHLRSLSSTGAGLRFPLFSILFSIFFYLFHFFVTFFTSALHRSSSGKLTYVYFVVRPVVVVAVVVLVVLVCFLLLTSRN